MASAQVILADVGMALVAFANTSAFASWLGLCPEKRVSGGKVLPDNSQSCVLLTKEPNSGTIFNQCEEESRRRAQLRLRR